MTIELRNITKTYRSRRIGKKTVLRDINAVFERGYSYGILGLNGAGKSTLLRIICGAERPTFGTVASDVTISWRLGFASSFNSSLTAMENLRFVCRIYDADIDEVMDFVADFSELGEAIHEPVRTYSSGMRARLGFALSMAIRFDVYVIDESIAAGDVRFQDKFKAEFERRREESDILMTSHAPGTINQYCDRAGVIHGGRLTMFEIGQGSQQILREDHRMIARVIDLIKGSDLDIDPRFRKRRLRFRVIAVGILVPTVLAFIYYALLARPEYETEMQFTIQGLAPQTPDLLTGIGLPAISRSGNDGLIVVAFIESRELVRRLQEDYGFDAAYGQWSFDPRARLSPEAPLEAKTGFWHGRSSASYESASNIVTVSVRAYSPEESLRLAEGVLAETENVVNSLNSRVQNEAVRVAEEEVATRRTEYEAARRRITSVRAHRATTLESEAERQIGLVAQLESRLANARVERAAALARFRPGSPQIRALNSEIAAMEAERAQAQATVREGPGLTEAARDISAQTALIDYEFAQTAYYAAIRARQQAINTRENERRYLVPFVPPTLPEVSNYWSRFTNVLAIAVASALLMGVATLGYSVIKDHMQ